MNIDQHQIIVNGLIVDVVRKDIKNLHLGVYPPAGRVRVAAPLRVNDEAVRLFTISRLPWIKRQQMRFQEQERQSEREMISGESHYYQGRRYLLNVIYRPGPATITLRNKKILDLSIRPGSDEKTRQRILTEWYRQQLKEEILPLIEKWQATIGVQASAWEIKQMKTRWGSCNTKTRRILLNLELAKKPVQCLEYIIVHELVHLLERHHNDRFAAYMNKFMPLWRYYRNELNRAPLAHEEWGY